MVRLLSLTLRQVDLFAIQSQNHQTGVVSSNIRGPIRNPKVLHVTGHLVGRDLSGSRRV